MNMQAAHDSNMQAACIPSVAPGFRRGMSSYRLNLRLVHRLESWTPYHACLLDRMSSVYSIKTLDPDE